MILPVAGRLTEQLREATRKQSALRPVAPEPDADPGGGRERPFGWWAMAFVVVLAVGGWFLMRTLQADSKLQDCVMSGRKNCAPLETPSGR
jgi:hypothetical protein